MTWRPALAAALAGVGVPAGSEPPAASADGFGAAEAAVELPALSPYPFGETRAVCCSRIREGSAV